VLSDKAISSDLDSWLKEYDNRYHGLNYSQKGKPSGDLNKKVILEFISREEVNVKD